MCPRTPSRCSSPELTLPAKKKGPPNPAERIKRALKGHICGLHAGQSLPSRSQSENRRRAAEESQAGAGAGSLALHPGRGGPASASVQTLWQSDEQETGTRSLGPEMVLCAKRYCEAPFFYKYLSHSLALSLALSPTLTLCLPRLLVWMGPPQRAED